MNKLLTQCTVSLVLALWLTYRCAGDEPQYIGAAEPTTNSEIYGQGVRETDWQTPLDEARGFHLPPGFRAQLFVSEPQIAKPLNLAWDHRGRLWLTDTTTYPYPAKPGEKVGDSIKILEDTDRDGQADKVSTFADGLNIPIGLLPVKGGAICYSIPNIWLLKDTDGDDHADEREIILGPFDTTRDTHGMVNSFRRGPDGWIYACHGFNNQSTVTARDGSTVRLNSGNVFRFREDGSSVELVTQGQVNPFGMTADEWENLYTADCHSKPLTALLPGGCYESFGRPHDGLGFAPPMMQHLHNSTAICGVEYYQAESFPSAYRNRFYSGNVMTSRINCNALEWSGATASARELPDFMTSDDPWFRPVDITLGPDGALYVADFYNKIIGHYEVPLEHPDRDRTSGRIWRITAVAADNKGETITLPHIPLEQQLQHPNVRVRKLAIERVLCESLFSEESLAKSIYDENQNSLRRLSEIEILARRNSLDSDALEHINLDSSPLVAALLLRLLDPSDGISEAQLLRLRKSLPNAHPQVAKQIIRLLGMLPSIENAKALLHVASQSSREAPVLSQASRIAFRRMLLLSGGDQVLANLSTSWAHPSSSLQPVSDDLVLARILPSVPTKAATEQLLKFLQLRQDDLPHETYAELLSVAIPSIAKQGDERQLKELLAIIAHHVDSDLVQQAASLNLVLESYFGEHGNVSASIRNAGIELQNKLQTACNSLLSEQGAHIAFRDFQNRSWGREPRNDSAGNSTMLMSSLQLGESYVGVLKSETFACPNNLNFLLAGHLGLPDLPSNEKCLVRLVLASTGEAIRTAFPPRSDVAQRVSWELAEHAGSQVRLEVVDNDSGDAYAWLAIGSFSLNRLNESSASPILDAIRLGLLHRLISPDFQHWLAEVELPAREKSRLVAAALRGEGREPIAGIAELAMEIDPNLVTVATLGNSASVSANELASRVAQSATASQQSTLSQALSKSKAGLEILLSLVNDGKISLYSVRDIAHLLPSALPGDLKGQIDFLVRKANELPESKIDMNSLATSIVQTTYHAQMDPQAGLQLFERHCATCHQLAGKGKLIGPQLDGAASRDIQRLCEDIFDPNRNVDNAFRTSTLLLEDERIVSGVVHLEGETVQVIQNDGTTLVLPASSIVERRDSARSLMPDNFAELLSVEQSAQLIQYIRRQALAPRP